MICSWRFKLANRDGGLKNFIKYIKIYVLLI